MPGDVDKEGMRYYISVDRINYSDGVHHDDCPRLLDFWLVEADVFGQSLTRRIPTNYGNNPDNWIASATSAGE